MGPKTFISCYVCLKEFGSASITFHEPKCLERWRSSNKSLPTDKRSPTPEKPLCWDNNQRWVCSKCHISVPAYRKSKHASVCFHKKSKDYHLIAKKTKQGIAKSLKPIDNKHNNMTGVVKTEFSPKKGKENKNNSNHIPVPCVGRKNLKNEAKSNESKDIDKVDVRPEVGPQECEEITSTSNRSVRPQTKILRRPTPNLKHPVIQMDSDDSSGDSSCSDKSKEDNPKRLKMGNESSSSDSGYKPKNFIIYNKNNVEKNTIKSSPKERASASVVPTIPNPCNSCNRSMAPERLHSHAKKDSRGLMYRKSPSLEVKLLSPQDKVSQTSDKPLSITKTEASQPKAPEALHKSPILDVKLTSPHQKVRETSTKSPTLDVKMTSPRKKLSDPLDVKMTSPQQKLSKLVIKSPSLEIKSNAHQKLPEASTKTSPSDVKVTPKLSKLLDRSPDPKLTFSHQKVTEASIKSQLLDVKMTSPKKKVSRTPPYKVLNRISKHVQGQDCVKDSANCVSENQNVEDALIVPEPALTTNEELVESEKACYICFKEFKVSALLLHESKCLETWKKENNALNPNLRQLPPRRPPNDEDDEEPRDEDDPQWTSVQSQLVPCQLCGRTFFPERLPVHKRVCKGKSSPRPLKRASSLKEQSASSTDGEDQKPAAPLYVPCYVCHRNYGSWVISMHEQQCLKKWRRENDKLPDEQKQEEPKRQTDLPDDDVASLVELGKNAWESHLQQLVPCPLCSRTFFPDRLGIHKRSCKGPPTYSSRRPCSNKGA